MGTSVDSKISMLNSELARPVKSATTDTFNTKNGWMTKALFVLQEHAKGEAKIFSNESLSSQGKQEALRTLGTKETAPGLKWIRNVIADLQEKDQRYRTQFDTVVSPIKDELRRELRNQEIRSPLAIQDHAQRDARFLLASQQDQDEVMAAMLDSPTGPMVSDEMKDRALTARAKRLTPQQVENFAQTQLLLEYLVMVRDWVGRWLFGEVGVPIEDIRKALGDEVADALTVQTTGLPQLAAAK